MSPVLPFESGREAQQRRLACARSCTVCREDWSAKSETMSMTATAIPTRIVRAPVRVGLVHDPAPRWFVPAGAGVRSLGSMGSPP
jgi:hypothetical protein